MIVGDLVSGSGKLAEALKNLQLQWTTTNEAWRDSAAKKFEENHLAPLQPYVRLTLDAISRLAETLERAQRECS
jgi:hypothetical protein